MTSADFSFERQKSAPRFFVSSSTALCLGDFVLHDENVHRHIQVQRLRLGDALMLFNGDGHEWLGELKSVQKKSLTLLLHSQQYAPRDEHPQKIAIHLICGLSASATTDMILQKATELGVSSIQMLHTQHGHPLPKDRYLQRQTHWQHVIQHACEQSRRNVLPQLFPIMTFKDFTARALPQGQHIAFLPETEPCFSAANALVQARQCNGGGLYLWFGPEGGFSKEEACYLMTKTHAKHLGERILRVETACLSVLGSLLYA